MKIAKMYGYLRKDLHIIEEALNEAIQADHPVLRKASTQLLMAGGKRIRPVFVLLSGQMGRYDIERIKTVAVSLELIHMASLVHDDVIDNADLRRGKPTVKKMYDNRVAMYMGDYIFARAIEYITTLQNKNAHHLLSKVMIELVAGEIEQIKDKYNWSQGLRDYLRKIRRKTALLIATSCKLGAIAADVPEFQAHKLYQYGYYIGMSYQIIDDILDFTSTAKELGKPVGHDLLQGNVTLPVLLAMQDRSFDVLLKEKFLHPASVTASDLEHHIDKLKQTNAIQRSYKVSDLYLNKALNALAVLDNNKAKHSLHDIATYIGKRRY